MPAHARAMSMCLHKYAPLRSGAFNRSTRHARATLMSCWKRVCSGCWAEDLAQLPAACCPRCHAHARMHACSRQQMCSRIHLASMSFHQTLTRGPEPRCWLPAPPKPTKLMCSRQPPATHTRPANDSGAAGASANATSAAAATAAAAGTNHSDFSCTQAARPRLFVGLVKRVQVNGKPPPKQQRIFEHIQANYTQGFPVRGRGRGGRGGSNHQH